VINNQRIAFFVNHLAVTKPLFKRWGIGVTQGVANLSSFWAECPCIPNGGFQLVGFVKAEVFSVLLFDIERIKPEFFNSLLNNRFL
jgi:hypothetical protein